MNLLKNETQVEEVVQETMLKVWLNRDKLPEVAYPKAWTFRIAANACYNIFRRRVLEEKSVMMLTGEMIEEQESTSDLITFREVKRNIEIAVENLAPQRKRIYKMNREQGMKVKEIAEKLGLAETTVKKTLQVSLEQIREALKNKGYMPVIAAIFLKLF